MLRSILAATLLVLSFTDRLPSQSGSVATDPSGAVPGRSPSQPIDEAYTKKILEYTTEPFFLSPLVSYLPASRTVPTPTAVLGDIAGAPNRLPYSTEVHQYMRLLAKATPRVRVYSIGTSEEGREMIAVAVASEALMARLDQNRASLAKLADPRSINLDDAAAHRLATEAVPVYYLTGAIHSPETGSPTALMELAYRLAVDESPYIRNIRNNLITLITPVVEVDGRDRQVDIFKWHLANPDKTWPSLLYWGRYVAHDNNRDAMGLTLKLTRNVLDTYVGWKAQVIHDLHESVPYLYDNTIGDGPFNAWVDPLLTNEWQMIGWHNVQEMTRMGMPGVFAHGYFDTWSPGYLMFMAATHNGISRLYETFGNTGGAETLERTLGPTETSRTWYRQSPPLPRVKWSLRNNNNYQQTGILVSLNYFAHNRRLFLENFYQKSKRSIQKAKTEGPAAYVFPADERRLGTQAHLLRILQLQHVEISRATAPFTAPLPAKKGTGPADSAKTRSFPAGSYLVRMDQPYSRIADALLDHQYWAPDDPQKNPYDDTGWTFPENFGVEAVRITDPAVLATPMERVSAPVSAPGGITGTGSIVAINHNGDNALMTLRYKLRTADIQMAEEPFEAAGVRFNRGSFLVSNVDRAELDRVTKDLGLRGYALGSAPAVKAHPARAAKIALMHNWISTQTEGWWRQAFDALEIPYEYISVQDIAKTADANARWDVILFPPTGGNGLAIVEGMPTWRNPMPWKNSPETPNIGTWAQTDDIRPGLGWDGLAKLREFVERGGVLVGVENTAEFAAQFGLTQGVTTNATKGRVVGTLLRSRMVDAASPISYGIPDSLAVYSSDGLSFTVSNGSGRFGRGSRGEASRPTGRGRADEADQTQGFQVLDSRFQLPASPKVEAWQTAPVTDDQLRNPTYIIPPALRPRVVLRFSGQKDLLVSGLLDNADFAERPIVVDVPRGSGHVVLFANNPVYRGSTVGAYFLVFNTILSHDNLGAGRVDAAR